MVGSSQRFGLTEGCQATWSGQIRSLVQFEFIWDKSRLSQLWLYVEDQKAKDNSTVTSGTKY